MIESTPSKQSAQADERSLQHVLWGLPALFTMGAIGIVACTIWLIPEAQLIHRYTETGRLRLQAGDYVGAQECYRRLLQFPVDESEIRYRLALTEWGLGRQNKAAKMMAELAPDEGGYAPAHLWWARRFLVAGGEPASTPALQNAEFHLRRAIERQPENPEAMALLGQMCLASGRAEEAERNLRVAAKAYPQLRIQLARAFRAVGKTELAEAEAEAALAHFQRLLHGQAENHAARMECARIAMFLGDYPSAVRLLREGLVRSESEGYQSALASACSAWASSLAESGAGGNEKILERLIQGLQYDPMHEELLHQLLAYAQQSDTASEQVTSALQANGMQFVKGPALHLVNGIECHRAGDVELARRHYEMALQAAPHVMLIANNLAWLLSHSEPMDLPRALSLATACVESSPQNLDYRDTRAHILLQLQRWEEARAEFELLVASRPDTAELHRRLAEVYEQLQQWDLAEQSRQRAGD